jgi:hypothetical protein
MLESGIFSSHQLTKTQLKQISQRNLPLFSFIKLGHSPQLTIVKRHMSARIFKQHNAQIINAIKIKRTIVIISLL